MTTDGHCTDQNNFSMTKSVKFYIFMSKRGLFILYKKYTVSNSEKVKTFEGFQ